jgi:xanthine dehydrogenase YagT iron-sulfur-binding subunit
MQDRESPNRYGPDVSRRAFLKGSSAVVAASAVGSAVADSVAQEKAASKVAPAKPVEITLHVNGKMQKLTLEPRVTLLDALRNDLNLTGCKEVCTTQNCGACTVIIDGKPTYACAHLAIAEQGKKITTVEALSEGKNVDQVITAFVKHDATQCGFCTPGFVVAVKAFLDKHPKANLEEIQKGLGGNLCRCGTYVGVTQAALELCQKGGA